MSQTNSPSQEEASAEEANERTLAQWTLPNSGELVTLEVWRSRDGFDAPRLLFLGSRRQADWIKAQVKLTRERGEQLDINRLMEQFEADESYVRKVIDPQAAVTVREYFLGRMTGRPKRTKIAGQSGAYPYRRKRRKA